MHSLTSILLTLSTCCQDKLKFNLVHPKALCMSACTLSPKLSQRYQALNMVVRDELCEGVRMGGSYTVIGVPMYNLAEGTQQSFISTTIEVRDIKSYVASIVWV